MAIIISRSNVTIAPFFRSNINRMIMKRIFIFFSLLICGNLFAQNKFSLGVKFGQNFSSIDNVAADHVNAASHFGATMQLGITDRIGIRPEVVFSQTTVETTTGMQYLLNPSAININPQTYNLNYLMIPILFDIKATQQFSLQLGPQYGIMLDQKKNGTELATLAFKSNEFSVLGGATLNLGGFFVYGRYVLGMTNVASAAQLEYQLKDPNQWRTKQWQLGIGLKLF